MSRFTYAPPDSGCPPNRSSKSEFNAPSSGRSFQSKAAKVASVHAPVAAPAPHPRGMGERSVDRQAHQKKAARASTSVPSIQKAKAAKAFKKIQREGPRQNLRPGRGR